METVENDLLARSLDFMDRAHEADKPFLAGRVPGRELNEDGFEGTAPVGSFPPNGYGQFAMIGNVWEWTTDWCEDPAKVSHACCSVECSQACIPRKVMKNSSHLCAPDYCRRYRPAARMPQPIATSISYLGIRCITPG